MLFDVRRKINHYHVPTPLGPMQQVYMYRSKPCQTISALGVVFLTLKTSAYNIYIMDVNVMISRNNCMSHLTFTDVFTMVKSAVNVLYVFVNEIVLKYVMLATKPPCPRK